MRMRVILRDSHNIVIRKDVKILTDAESKLGLTMNSNVHDIGPDSVTSFSCGRGGLRHTGKSH